MPITKASGNSVTAAAKGDLVVGNATNDSGILSVGTANQVLTVDSSTATGLKWASASSSITNDTATVATQQSTTSTSYTDLTTAGPAVTLTTGTKALVIITTEAGNNASGAFAQASFAISGATTTAASDANAVKVQNTGTTNSMYIRGSAASIMTLTAGSNTFTMKYKDDSTGTAFFKDRTITVINLG